MYRNVRLKMWFSVNFWQSNCYVFLDKKIVRNVRQLAVKERVNVNNSLK